MNASLYFELVDAVARVDGEAGLSSVAQQIAATPMHPLERRVLERALRARAEALALRGHVPTVPLNGTTSEPKPLVARG